MIEGKVYDFKESIKYGKAGEDTVINFLLNSNTVKRIEDVRNHVRYQADDIDIIVVDKSTSSKHSCEIKTDSYTSGNLFYETSSCLETGSLGCMEKTKAEYILYYFENYGELYILMTEEFRKFFDTYRDRFKRVTVKNKRKNGGTYTTEGYLIPKQFINNHFTGGTVVKIDPQ